MELSVVLMPKIHQYSVNAFGLNRVTWCVGGYVISKARVGEVTGVCMGVSAFRLKSNSVSRELLGVSEL